jgi:hypothetical protein
VGGCSISASQVFRALFKHGDHFFQHVALRFVNLNDFKVDAENVGASFAGDISVRADAFGPVSQIFGSIFDAVANTPDEGNFYEFVERSEDDQEESSGEEHHDFDDSAADRLFKAVEEAARAEERRQFFK